MKNCTSLLLVFSVTVAFASAQLRLPNALSDHMVLQRESQVLIWGWGQASLTVSVKPSWSNDTVHTKVDAYGRWGVKITTLEAGGPHNLFIVSGRDTAKLDDILIGDVWVCSGQSNMEWGGSNNLGQILEELPHANDDKIRLLQVSRYASDFPQDDIPDSWKTLDSSSLRPFSGIGYFIAKRIRQNIDVPIGIVNASWGGTPAEVWTPSHLIANDTLLRRAANLQGRADYRPHQSGVLWNSMIHPLTYFPVSGFFWYQGESNVRSWFGYDKLMQTLIRAWRTAWQAEKPFYFVQIAPFAYNNKVPLAALLREQQAKTAGSLSNVAMVVTTDLVDDVNEIHPAQKREVADRLARIALNEHYQVLSEKDYHSPRYRDFSVAGDTIKISFTDSENGLLVDGERINELYIAGDDRIFHDARGMVMGNQLIVFSHLVSKPVAVRFCFSETAVSNLYNTNGLPVSPFRTDDWNF